MLPDVSENHVGVVLLKCLDEMRISESQLLLKAKIKVIRNQINEISFNSRRAFDLLADVGEIQDEILLAQIILIREKLLQNGTANLNDEAPAGILEEFREISVEKSIDRGQQEEELKEKITEIIRAFLDFAGKIAEREDKKIMRVIIRLDSLFETNFDRWLEKIPKFFEKIIEKKLEFASSHQSISIQRKGERDLMRINELIAEYRENSQ